MMPPGDDDGRPPPGEPAHAEQVVATTTSTPATIKTSRAVFDSKPDAPRQCPETRPWWRRRLAAQRVVPLDCGCGDPWLCRCTQPPLSDHALDGWRDAAQHILDCGQIPLVPLEIRRALWRRQGSDRLLAERLHQACGEVVA
jgi:hypothetical protein